MSPESIRLQPRRFPLSLAAVMLVVLAGAAASPAPARQPPGGDDRNGVDVTGTITDRDNTRVIGTVYDSSGQAMTDVNIWVANDESPSQRIQIRTRKSGTYLARGLGRLYTERDIEGVVLRLSFERAGYQTVEAKVAVRKNEMGVIHPILWREGESPPPDHGICMLLSGAITDSRGKPVRNANVVARAADKPDLRVETATDKGGRYELLLWSAPEQVELEITAPGNDSVKRQLTLDRPDRQDVVELGTLDIATGS